MTFSLAFAVGPWGGTALLDACGGLALWGSCLAAGLLSAAMFWGIWGERAASPA